MRLNLQTREEILLLDWLCQISKDFMIKNMQKVIINSLKKEKMILKINFFNNKVILKEKFQINKLFKSQKFKAMILLNQFLVKKVKKLEI